MQTIELFIRFYWRAFDRLLQLVDTFMTDCCFLPNWSFDSRKFNTQKMYSYLCKAEKSIWNSHNYTVRNLRMKLCNDTEIINLKSETKNSRCDPLCRLNDRTTFNFDLPNQFMCIYQFMSFLLLFFIVWSKIVDSIISSVWTLFPVLQCCCADLLPWARDALAPPSRTIKIHFQLTVNRRDTMSNDIIMLLFSEVCARASLQ